MPAYSIEAVPYRWTNRKLATDVADKWAVQLDHELEDEADRAMGWSSDWLQDHRNQLRMLDSFFSAVDPGRSLVFIYAKDVPLLEDRQPGTRILVGVGRVRKVDPSVEWSYSAPPQPGQLRSVLWERAVHHSIRPGFEDGFLLPYQALLSDPKLAGEDLGRFVALAPPESFEEFSYVCELVGHDGAIAALAELARVVDLLPGVVDGPWAQVARWLSDRLADAWEMRGAYPGLGSALAAAGLERGALIAHRVIEGLDDATADPWAAVDAAIRQGARGEGLAAGLVGRVASRIWNRFSSDVERLRFLKLVARFPLTVSQARRFFDRDIREQQGITLEDADFLGNPYLFYEADRGRVDAITLQSIDRSLFPRDGQARAVLDRDPLAEPVTEAGDDRRVRAACTFVLEKAAAEGHTLLDEPSLRRRMATVKIEPPCDPTTDVFSLAAEGFQPVLRPSVLADEKGRGWQLGRLAEASHVIREEMFSRINGGPLPADWDWRELIDRAIGHPANPQDVDDVAARAEKADALRVLAASRVGMLVGPAGTGKTTMLRALCTHAEVASGGVLLLAPTGKARVQLGEKVGAKAMTLAQFLRTHRRWDPENGYHLNGAGPKSVGYRTVVVDEASMLTEEMLAALIDAVEGVERLVLCGDHRQLPPIGAGRPFADVVRHLESTQGQGPASGGGLAMLSVSMRQRSGAAGEPGSGSRDDLAIASLFSVDGAPAAADEVLARVLRGDGDGTIDVVPWTHEEDLFEKVRTFLVERLGIESGSGDALRASLGATSEHNGRLYFTFGEGGAGAEHWQLLSPVRARDGGTNGLNRLVRRTWRGGDATWALRSWQVPPPMGADEILAYDKVMCTRNHGLESWNVAQRAKAPGAVANGEIGMVVHWAGRKGARPSGIKVEFSTQPGLQFTFWGSDLNGESERSDDLELAYAITVHKAQGSQFGTTLVIVPNPCPLLCPELLYTALTRQRDKTVLFVQGDPAELRTFGDPRRSQTARRLTCLLRPADPFEIPEQGLFDGAHIHRTSNGELVRSKSEVIVAETLRRLNVPYRYEEPLVMRDGTERLPDFTIRIAGKPTIYWEHLGMLGRAGYRADWEAKKVWYAEHGILPWDGGGGEQGVLVWSDETFDGRIDAAAVEAIAQGLLG